ncbi:hypothetical protein PENSTE_c001G00231 [Penicillium steckii]|uniref:Altered inheritance of mitochondria protein 9, mitochondrial n=1 Tax=Penicillium steckii TaxID=303698 RepID=A0A1V6U0U0_9EURO|nr:hypothetical protein PENSTE_c001G00231 [Penicillium steckii]
MLRSLSCLTRRFVPSSYLLSFSRGHHALASMPNPPTDWNSHHEFFHLTSYRFVCDEKRQTAMRNVQFDMNSLAKIAAASIGFEECTDVKKLDEGLYNKVFLFTMEDGSQVVGKVPCRNAGRPHFTTASEVATMDFVRTVLETPVPKVLAWSSQASENNVGAEYIIMEKAHGIELIEKWPEMDISTRTKFLKSLARILKAWTSTSFSSYGSLYYPADLEDPKPCVLTKTDGSKIEEPRFAIGPSNSRMQSDDGRTAIDFDRGPWDTIEQYQHAVAYREIACVKNLTDLSLSKGALFGPRTFMPSRPKMLAALQSFLQLIPFILPTDSSISAPSLWHGDLHMRNILVNPEKPWQVQSLIDWQFNALEPLFQHAVQPDFLTHDGPELEGLERPKFPENFNQMPAEEKQKAENIYYDQALVALYRTLVSIQIPVLYKAIEYRETTPFAIIRSSGLISKGCEAFYQTIVKDAKDTWSSIPGVQAAGNPEFPIHFFEDEICSIDKDMIETLLAISVMQNVKDVLGDRLMDHFEVWNQNYDEVKNLLAKCKTELMDGLGCAEDERRVWDKTWPFDE